ncbi:TetR/AcrR family transcriptional regulator [Streptomyces sp. NPDC088194]|uniref:TetR/AcrR family transcriptional regulator n=1 Tax=Streptomyces sp. NPDC088194 TaxID=3154931 RepID=UPI00344C93FD
MTERAPRRADAEQNRARIVDVARVALTESADATLNSIAKRAGVGQGTLYRHFATREALLLAVYRQDIEELLCAAPELLRAHEQRPLDALRLWLDRLAAYGRIKHGVAQAVEAATRADLSNEYYDRVIDTIGSLLRAGQDAGAVRADVDAPDVLLLVDFLWRSDQGPDWEPRTRHLLGLVLDGLRARPGASAGASAEGSAGA